MGVIACVTYYVMRGPDVFLKVFNDVSDDLERFGERVAREIYDLGYNAELNQPKIATV